MWDFGAKVGLVFKIIDIIYYKVKHYSIKPVDRL